MRVEKQSISSEYLGRLNASPYFIVVDYQGLRVGPMTELRKRLSKAGAQIHVVKNSLFRLAVKESGVTDSASDFTGQLAVVTGTKDISSAAKVLKTFGAEFDRPSLRFGFLADQRLGVEELTTLADLPPLEVLRAQIMGTIHLPATRLVQMINTPATQLARVLKARLDKEEK